MRHLLAIAVLFISFISCGVLHSNTVIKPNDSFILGNNEHGSFQVNLQNASKHDLTVYMAPIAGGKHSSQTIQPSGKVKLKVDPNTALYIVNSSNDTASVNLKVTGDLGLSMGYKN